MKNFATILTTLIVLLILCGSTMETNAKVVGYWSFNNKEDIGKDSSPNHNHGELKGRDTAKWSPWGIAGGGLKLDGGSWLEVPHDESLNLKDQLTLMCWVKFADLNDFDNRFRQGLIWKPTPNIIKAVSYGLYAGPGLLLELGLPLYSNNNFSLYVFDPKCKGQFIAGVPDFPAGCQRRFIYDRRSTKRGDLVFKASMPHPSPVSVHAVHPTFFTQFALIDQDFFNELAHITIGSPDIYLPIIVRDFENLDKIWFHFAAVADGKRIRLYVNGREKISERQGQHWQTEPFINSQESLMIGRSFNPAAGLGDYLNGIIDEVMILDHALTENEIKEAMELGKTGKSLERFLPVLPEVSVVAPDSPQIYWTDEKTGKIQRTNLDGTNVEDLVTGLISPTGIALDEASGKMYWANAGKIQRANLNGTNVEDLVTRWKSTYHDIALDMVGGKIYWTNLGINTIQCANIDGTNVQTLELMNLLLPTSVALDVVGDKMYWAATSKIQRANLDATNIEDLVTGMGWSYDIALDVAGGKMYWTVAGKIQRANLDGTNVEDLVLMDGLLPESIALDVVGGKMYWAVAGKIQRANLDGTNVEDLVTGLSRPRGIALALSSAPSFGVESQGKLVIQWGEIKKDLNNK